MVDRSVLFLAAIPIAVGLLTVILIWRTRRKDKQFLL